MKIPSHKSSACVLARAQTHKPTQTEAEYEDLDQQLHLDRRQTKALIYRRT